MVIENHLGRAAHTLSKDWLRGTQKGRYRTGEGGRKGTGEKKGDTRENIDRRQREKKKCKSVKKKVGQKGAEKGR